MNRVLSNLGAVLLSLILAVGVWVLAVQDENPVISGDYKTPIPVTLVGLDDNLSLVGRPVEQVVLTLRATRKIWDESLRAQDFIVTADLTGLGPGRHNVEMAASYPGDEVEILALKPDSLVVTLEEIVTEQVPVEVEVIGEPVFGYEWRNAVSDPTQVQITGPASAVAQVARAVVEVAVTGARATVERQQPVSLRNERNELVSSVTNVTPRSVQVVVQVAQRPGYRDFSVRVPYTGTVAVGYQVSGILVEPSLVTLRGNPDAFESLPGFVETVPVDINDATDDVTAQLALDLPESLSAVGLPSVGVRILVDPIVGSRTVQAEPVIRGLGQGLTRTVPIDTVDLIVRGPLPILDNLGVTPVQAIIDVSGLEPGIHPVPLTPVVPEGVDVISVLPQSVDITIFVLPTPTPGPAEPITSTLTPTSSIPSPAAPLPGAS